MNFKRSSCNVNLFPCVSVEPGDDTITEHESVEGNSRFYSHGPNYAHSHSRSSKSNKYTSDDDESSNSITSGSGKHGTGPSGTGVAASGTANSSSLSPGRHHTPVTGTGQLGADNPPNTPNLGMIDLDPVIMELQNRRDEVNRLSDEIDGIKSQLQSECTVFHQSLQDERYRFEVCSNKITIESVNFNLLCCFIRFALYSDLRNK